MLNELDMPRLDAGTTAAAGLAQRLHRPTVVSSAPVRILAPGTRLFSETDLATLPHEVLDGAVVLSRTSRDGQRQILDIAGPGRVVGLAVRGVHLTDAETLVRTRIRTLDSEAAPALIAAEMQTSLLRIHDHAVLLGRKSARERVAAGLIELAAMFSSAAHRDGSAERSFVLPLSRGDLADWLGLVLETVSRTLSSLQRDGIIAIERTDIVHVIDPVALEAAAACDRPHRRPGRAA